MNIILVLPFKKRVLLLQIKLGKAISTDVVSHSFKQLQICPKYLHLALCKALCSLRLLMSLSVFLLFVQLYIYARN